MDIRKELSSTLMVSNLLATVMVIAIHYNFYYPKFLFLDSVNWNFLFQEFFTNGIARVSVPFFAMVSGFFLLSKIKNFSEYIKIIKIKTKSLLIPYLIGSTVVFISWIIYISLYSTNKPHELNLYITIRSIIAQPESIQYWFLRDLIILTIISPAILNNNRILNYVLGFCLGVLWFLDIQPFPIVAGWYLISIETIFFFWLGGFLYKNIHLINYVIQCSDKVKFSVFITWLCLISIRIAFDHDLNVWYANNYTIESILLYKFAIFVGVFSTIQISEKFRNVQFLIYLSGLTFFAFLYHLVPLQYFVNYISNTIMDKEYSFYFNFPVATLLVFILAAMTSHLLPSLYSIITGGRSPDKTMQRASYSHAKSD